MKPASAPATTEATITLPPATAAGQPVLEAEEMPVAVCTHYMVGNRDWPLHLRGTQYDLIIDGTDSRDTYCLFPTKTPVTSDSPG